MHNVEQSARSSMVENVLGSIEFLRVEGVKRTTLSHRSRCRRSLRLEFTISTKDTLQFVDNFDGNFIRSISNEFQLNACPHCKAEREAAGKGAGTKEGTVLPSRPAN